MAYPRLFFVRVTRGRSRFGRDERKVTSFQQAQEHHISVQTALFLNGASRKSRLGRPGRYGADEEEVFETYLHIVSTPAW
jgi:hypothetical protein